MSEKLNTYEALVKKYLDKQSEIDTALKNVYDSTKIKDCFKYITELARKQAVNNCAMIEDSQVYKWARDYYIEELTNRENADKVIVKSEKVVQDENKVISSKNEDLSKYKNLCQMEFNF